MKKYSKYFIIIFCVLAFLVSICFIPINASRLIPSIEEQVSKDLGVKIHIERLILRLGPLLKVKAPIMHMMYEDGQKFAQFDNVKFYIPWLSIIKDQPIVHTLYANKLTIRINSDDKYLPEFLDRLDKKDFDQTPNVHLKGYSITYMNKDNNDKYSVEGSLLELDKIVNYKNLKVKTLGSLFINNKKYITYDLGFVPKFDLPEKSSTVDLTETLTQIKELDFHSDVIADVKFYKNQDNVMQASGFINIDNISVLDREQKGPKSFAYLTLWGDKASILSNIYTSQNKKVSVEGKINNSKKPVLDLKVKTDEISLNDLYQKLKIFADFSKIKDIKKIDGTLNANFTLNGDLNKIKSSGYMKISNASVQADGLKIDKINSEIDFSNNSINIVNAVGYVNNAPILAKGSINKNIDVELLMNKVELKYLCPSSWGVKNGIASLVADISGTLDNIVHKENLQVENLKLENSSAKVNIENLKFDTNKSNSAYINNIVCNTKETGIIKIPSLKVIIDRDLIKIPNTSIFMPNSKLTANSEIINYNSPNFSFNTTVNGFINSKDLIKLNTYSTRYPVKLSFNGDKTVQNLNAQVLLEKTDVLDEPAIVNLASKIEKNNLKIDDLSILSFSGKLSDDFKANLKGNKKLIVTGLLEDIKNPSMKNIRVFIPQIFDVHLNDAHAQFKGDLFVNGKFDKPEIVGQLNIQNMCSQMLQLSLNSGTIDFNKNVAVLNAPVVKIADSTLGVNALVSTDITNALNIKNISVKSKYINTDTILMYKDSPILNAFPVNINDGKFYSERILANIYNTPVYLTAFSSNIKLNNRVLSLKNIASEMYNGKLAGSMDYNMKDEVFDSRLMARGASAAPIFDIISNRKDTISGTIDFDSLIKGELTSKESLNGSIKFVVHNGRMSTLGKLEHLLYAQNVIADNMLRTSLSVVTKAITLKDTGLFKYLQGDIQLEKGIANIKMLQSQGPLMALYIKGQYNPVNDYAKMVVLGRVSDEVMSGLGAFGDFSLNKLMVMLTGEDAKANIVPEDFEKIPQLSMSNTKEFKSIINGVIDKPSSVISFNWVSYSKKSLKQKDVPMSNVKVPAFIEELPY